MILAKNILDLENHV